MSMDDDDNDDDKKDAAKKRSRRMLLIIGAAVIAVLGALAGIAFMMGWLDDILGLKPQTLEELAQDRDQTLTNDFGHFMPLEEMTVALQSNSGGSRFLKLNLVLELDSPDDEVFVQQVMPRILDNFQIFLRELRVSEMQGSQGIYRVREELLRRINAATNPLKIRDVLFADILIQ